MCLCVLCVCVHFRVFQVATNEIRIDIRIESGGLRAVVQLACTQTHVTFERESCSVFETLRLPTTASITSTFTPHYLLELWYSVCSPSNTLATFGCVRVRVADPNDG